MKFLKDLSRYNISTENGFNVSVLDENFEYSISEYILCKIHSKSKIGYDLLMLYSSIGDPIHCFNKPFDEAYDISKYRIIFTESDNKWYNVRVGVTGQLESSKGYSSYQEALENKLPSDEYTIFLEDASNDTGPSLSDLIGDEKISGKVDEKFMTEMNNLRQDIALNTRYSEKLMPNIKVIDHLGNDVTERVKEFKRLWSKVTKFDIKLLSIVSDIHKIIKLNEYDRYIISDLMKNTMNTNVIDLYELGHYNIDLDYRYPEKRRLLYLSFLVKYPSLKEYLDDKDSLIREYVILVYGGNKDDKKPVSEGI